ncbi:acyl carrier protein phosphodiesterase [Ferruginibacter albus]|uniref:acyl carrier protein phosphodiesterase n=1 Tax=Ferruginibacter albus TaxID=2875540 RepID=UPI001CC46329|nr:ACP phosphodiesterase [Ferruginibacter albus]UAY51922.1 ACP phosphodiesterase [Ferruginibacter albus]
MNYLAHAYLSFNDPDILVGNMISDYVKGRKKFDYSPGIQKGIELHRFIDDFTDHHPATQKAKEFFKKDYRLYSGAFVDIVYDHFLAKSLSNDLLQQFSFNAYRILEQYESIFPERFKKLFPYMRSENWLNNYQNQIMIEKSFRGLVYRAKFIDDASAANDIFRQHYKALNICFDEFFPELYKAADQKFNELVNN